MPADSEVVRKLKEHATQKLDLIFRYARTHLCRRQMILDYFGDPAEVIDCNCDVCRRGEAPLASGPAVIVSDEVVTIVRQLLSAVARLRSLPSRSASAWTSLTIA